jgi:5-methyltetrahydropteroyltriglutamate--homocysteine methyltransferase
MRPAFHHLPPEQLMIAPDRGMKYVSRDAAADKMRAIPNAAAIVRAEMKGKTDDAVHH